MIIVKDKGDEDMFPSKRVRSMVGRKIHVEMKGEQCVLEGMLASVDDYLNLYLTDASEILDGERKRLLGSVILRGNNVVLINPLNG